MTRKVPTKTGTKENRVHRPAGQTQRSSSLAAGIKAAAKKRDKKK